MKGFFCQNIVVCYSFYKIYSLVLVMIAHATIWEFVHILVELKCVAMCLPTHSNFFKACLFFTAKFKLNLILLL